MKPFNLHQVTRSDVATRKNITEQFTPPADVIANAQTLHEMILSKIPFEYFISSFYRCPKLNTAIGGAKNSDHMLGRSADLDSIDNKHNAAIFNWIKANCEFDQLIWEFGTDTNPDWVHVSYRKNNNRNQTLRAVKVNGKTSYIGV